MIRRMTVAATNYCIVAGTAGLLLAGTPATAQDREISTYPEARTYGDCVITKAMDYASQSDPVVDLAFAAVGACRIQRNRMEEALRLDNRRRFVDTFMEQNRRSMIELASEAIIETRRRTQHRR